jgi:hypothetical protein
VGGLHELLPRAPPAPPPPSWGGPPCLTALCASPLPTVQPFTISYIPYCVSVCCTQSRSSIGLRSSSQVGSTVSPTVRVPSHHCYLYRPVLVVKGTVLVYEGTSWRYLEQWLLERRMRIHHGMCFQPAVSTGAHARDCQSGCQTERGSPVKSIVVVMTRSSHTSRYWSTSVHIE